jgi:hypothetical protein
MRDGRYLNRSISACYWYLLGFREVDPTERIWERHPNGGLRIFVVFVFLPFSSALRNSWSATSVVQRFWDNNEEAPLARPP